VKRWTVTRVWRDVLAESAVDATAKAELGRHVSVIAQRQSLGIEQDRRNFMEAEPALYAYIEALVAARELERAGGDASGATSGEGAANRVWALAGKWRERAERMRQT
jgi:hypothetical protein